MPTHHWKSFTVLTLIQSDLKPAGLTCTLFQFLDVRRNLFSVLGTDTMDLGCIKWSAN